MTSQGDFFTTDKNTKKDSQQFASTLSNNFIYGFFEFSDEAANKICGGQDGPPPDW